MESKCPTTSIYIEVASTSLSQLIGKGWDVEFRVISVPFRGYLLGVVWGSASVRVVRGLLIPGLGSGAFRVLPCFPWLNPGLWG